MTEPMVRLCKALVDIRRLIEHVARAFGGADYPARLTIVWTGTMHRASKESIFGVVGIGEDGEEFRFTFTGVEGQILRADDVSETGSSVSAALMGTDSDEIVYVFDAKAPLIVRPGQVLDSLALQSLV